jgi:prepilin-type N-terminal cleavage/methylation domain-containing protein
VDRSWGIDEYFVEKRTARSAFTLIEIMIVVAIIGSIMAMSIPFARDALHKEALNKAIDDVREVCENARTLAILRGSMTEVVFHGKDGRFEVVGAGAGEQKNTGGPPASGMSGQLGDDLAFAALRINGVDILKLSEADVARVRFYPNGTCDELRLVLLRSSTGESRGLFLEITTGLVTFESDRWKLAQEVR